MLTPRISISESQRLLVAPCLRQELARCEAMLAGLERIKSHAKAVGAGKKSLELRLHYAEKMAALKATLELLIDVSA